MGASVMRFKVIAFFTAILFVLASTLTISVSTAASKSPTPTPKASITKKAPAKKAPVKKTPVKKKKKKEAKKLPSPSPMWPPVGFKTDSLNETKLYLKVPNAKEVVGILSAKSALASQIKGCTQFTCGAVQVASEIGCRWWRVNADLVGPTSPQDRTVKIFGKITADVTRSAPRAITTILLVSDEPIGVGQIFSNITINCNQGEPSPPLPKTVYQKIEG